MRKLLASLLVVSAFMSAGVANAALVSKNAYAYDIAVATTSTEATVTYRLNAIATAVSVEAWSASGLEKSYTGTANEGVNTVRIPMEDLPAGTEISIKVKVTSSVVSTPTQASIDGQTNNFWDFYSPFGLTVDNNTEHASFGRIFVTESKSSANSQSAYHSSTAKGGVGTGVYAFDPLMQPIANASNGYGFRGGIAVQDGTYGTGSDEQIYQFKRLAMSDDGRLFLANEETITSCLWEFDPENLDAAATQVFQGTFDTSTGYVQDGSGNFIAGPATAMDVWGSGADLKVGIVSCKYGESSANADHRVDIYNLGTAATWSAVPSQNVTSASYKYWVADGTTNMLFDVDGNGIMIGQNRGTPTTSEPSYVHFNLTTDAEDYKDITTLAGGAGMAWNADKSLLAMSSISTVGVYKVTYDASGAPSFALQYSFAPGLGNNINAVAWDVAGNLYACSNSAEKFATYAMPRESGDVTVAAASKYAFVTPDEVIEENPGDEDEDEDEEVVDLGERNAYAYNIKVAHNARCATVSYRLNAAPEKVVIVAYAGDEVVGEFEGTAEAGKNSVEISMTDLPASTEISFAVKVTSKEISAPTLATITNSNNNYWDFYSPFGIAVDNDTESANFGRVLVTETKPNADTQTKYVTSPANGGIGAGIYAFNPQLQLIKNSSGGYGYRAGVPEQAAGEYDGATGVTIMDYKQLKYSADGRLFLGCEEITCSSLWELNPGNLEADATEVFKGTLDTTTGYVNTSSGTFVAGPAVAFDLWGSGADLKVAILSCQGGASTNYFDYHHVHLYDLGTATTWSTAPTMEVTPISGKYWISDAGINMLFDLDGDGLTVVQSRQAPSSTEPSIVHVSGLSSTAVEDYKNYEIQTFGGAMAWNCDHTMFAMSMSEYSGANQGRVSVYGYDGSTFTLKYEIASGVGRYVNALAWDIADNLYVCSNSGEKFGCFAVPQADRAVTVDAPEGSSFVTPDPIVLTYTVSGSGNGVTITSEEEGFELNVDFGDYELVTFSAGEGNKSVTITGAVDGEELIIHLADEYTIVKVEAEGAEITTIDVSALTDLIVLDLSDNNLTGIDLDGLNSLDNVDLSDNYFTFSTLPSVSASTYVYAPQADVEIEVDGVSVDLSSEYLDAKTSYAWYYDDGGQLVEGVDYTISGGVTTFLVSQTEIYCVMTNDDFPDLELKTTVVDVTVTSTGLDSVESSGAAVSVVGDEIIITGEFDQAAIYNTAGVAVVAKAAASNKVLKGIYIVIVDGKAVKVAVR